MRRVALLAIALSVGCDRFLKLDEVSAPDAPPPDAPPPPPSAWQSVSISATHACGIHVDGTLWCWGRNDSQQLGTADVNPEADSPEQVGTGTWLAVAAGVGYTCAIDAGNILSCWGLDNYGQLGTGTPAAQTTPVTIPGTFKALAASTYATYAIDTSGGLWTWGDESNGELGDGQATGGTLEMPHQIATTTQFTAISAGVWFACALDTAGRISCWGYNGSGQLGNGSFTPMPTPMPITDAGPFTSVAAGRAFACGLKTSGELRCWGDNGHGQLGNDSTTSSNVPVIVGADQIKNWSELSLGATHSCARTSDGTMYCWGNNEFGALAYDTGPLAFSGTPKQVVGGGTSWIALGAGWRSTCAIDGDHDLWCAGNPGLSRAQPSQVTGTFASASAGDGVTCALDTGNDVKCWGENEHDRVGDGTGLARERPVMTDGASSALSASVAVCDVDSSSHLRCWGQNVEYEVSGASQNPVASPTQVGTAAWVQVATSTHVCAVTTVNSLWCWGRNSTWQCGTNATNSLKPELPNQVTGGWIEVAVGDAHTCAIANNSAQTIYCWGENDYGQLGNGTSGGPSTTPTPQAVTFSGGKTFSHVYAGAGYSCALTTGNELWCWGIDNKGQLGDGMLFSVSTPKQVPGTWLTASAGFTHVCAIDSNHALYCWGANDWGQLGTGTWTEQHTPAHVGSDSDWQTVTAGNQHTCGMRSGGALYCWGRNDSGEVGDGSAWTSTFHQVP